jgi:hypothetical protein
MPEILMDAFEIRVTVPELVAMQKTYDKAKAEGWRVEDVSEWAALSEKQRETFKQLRKQACDRGLPINEYIESLAERGHQLSVEIERLSGNVERLKLEKKSLDERCSRENRWLEEDYELKKKSLEEKYLRDIDGCRVEFLKFKERLQAMKNKPQNDCKEWETKLDSLRTECSLVEKQRVNIVREAMLSLDKISSEKTEAVKERDMARGELKQIRALVGPNGAMADLAKQKEELKAQLAERDRQLVEKALQMAGKWLNQEEALQIVNEEGKRLKGEVERECRLALDVVECRIENAGPALRVLEFLES